MRVTAEAQSSARKRLINDVMGLIVYSRHGLCVCVCDAVTLLCITLRAELMLRSKYRTRGGGLQLTGRKQSCGRYVFALCVFSVCSSDGGQTESKMICELVSDGGWLVRGEQSCTVSSHTQLESAAACGLKGEFSTSRLAVGICECSM